MVSMPRWEHAINLDCSCAVVGKDWAHIAWTHVATLTDWKWLYQRAFIWTHKQWVATIVDQRVYRFDIELNCGLLTELTIGKLSDNDGKMIRQRSENNPKTTGNIYQKRSENYPKTEGT